MGEKASSSSSDLPMSKQDSRDKPLEARACHSGITPVCDLYASVLDASPLLAAWLSGQAVEPARHDKYYQEYRALSDLREPHRIPPLFLRDIFDYVPPDYPESPTIAFINPRSGGRAGPNLAIALRRALGVTQVYDVGTHRPDKVLTQLWQNFGSAEDDFATQAEMMKKRLRVIACGGDGTVAWILQSIERCNIVPAPAVAIIPLGTGNDLARSFGWGGSFDSSWTQGHEAMYKNMRCVSEAAPVALDRWKLTMTAPTDGYFERAMPYAFIDDPAESGMVAKTAYSWNYVSVGMDAKAAHDFHHLREEKPSLTFSRMANQFWYGYFSCTGGWFCGSAPINRKLKLQLQQERGGEWRDVPVPAAARAIVLLNLVSYGGGRNLWGKHDGQATKQGFTEPVVDDGKVEVVAFGNGWNAGVVMAGAGHAVRLGQASGVRIHVIGATKKPASKPKVYMQLDGEPWKQDVPLLGGDEKRPFVIEMVHDGVSTVLKKPGFKHHGSVAAKDQKAPGTIPGGSGTSGVNNATHVVASQAQQVAAEAKAMNRSDASGTRTQSVDMRDAPATPAPLPESASSASNVPAPPPQPHHSSQPPQSASAIPSPSTPSDRSSTRSPQQRSPLDRSKIGSAIPSGPRTAGTTQSAVAGSASAEATNKEEPGEAYKLGSSDPARPPPGEGLTSHSLLHETAAAASSSKSSSSPKESDEASAPPRGADGKVTQGGTDGGEKGVDGETTEDNKVDAPAS